MTLVPAALICSATSSRGFRALKSVGSDVKAGTVAYRNCKIEWLDCHAGTLQTKQVDSIGVYGVVWLYPKLVDSGRLLKIFNHHTVNFTMHLLLILLYEI